MSLMALAFPIQPGKVEAWREWADELNGPRRREYAASRDRVGIHERTFLQSTPQGDIVVVTFEGEDAADALRKLADANDPFTVWFRDKVKEIHGVDLAKVTKQPAPMLVIDSDTVAVPTH